MNASNFERRGYVAVFEEPMTRPMIEAFVGLWLETFARVEQALRTSETATREVKGEKDVDWEDHMAFRICHGDDFSWAYLSPGGRVIETTGFAGIGDEPAQCLSLLVILPGVMEVVADTNERRLDELEAQGLI
ncbi:MAG: hypothetical protein SFY92_04095 [Verrucomicrobiae bacterium]|nr:hypothetical protein [Verrucomicrobiae bacterium]